MMYAAKDGRLDVMNYLYDHGAKVTAQDVAGMTPAHFAVQTNQAEALVLLMELHLKDLAKRREYIDSLTKMAENAASATALSAKTTLEAIQKQPAVAENIVLDISSMNRTTPLHIAAGMDAREAVAVLLDYGVRVRRMDSTSL
jgi:ankyrin repeat protein